MSLWTLFLHDPLINLLMFVYQAAGSNLGLAIILVTALVRIALIPLTAPGMKSAQKMQELKPQLDKLKKKFKDDKQGLAQAQMQLYKEQGINPLGGILPMVFQFIILIALFQVFRDVLESAGGNLSQINDSLYSVIKLPQSALINTHFFHLDVTQPDLIKLPQALNLGFIKLDALPGVVLILAAAIQLVSSKLMMAPKAPDAQKPQQKQKKAKNTPTEPDMGQMIQKQMMIMMPLMTLVIGYSFPSGLVLYWLTFSLIMIIQQKFIKGKKPAKLSE